MPGELKRRREVVSRPSSAASDRGAWTRLAVPAIDRVVRKRRRVCAVGIGNPPFPLRSRLQLAFELVQKAPIRAVGDYLLRGRLDEAHLVEPQGIKADGVLGVVLTPFVVRVFAQRAQGIVVARSETAIDKPSRGERRIGGAEVGSLENRAQHA